MEHGQLTGPNGMRNICGEYHDFAAVGIPQQGADIFGKVGTAVYHGQQNTVDLQFGIDRPGRESIPRLALTFSISKDGWQSIRMWV